MALRSSRSCRFTCWLFLLSCLSGTQCHGEHGSWGSVVWGLRRLSSLLHHPPFSCAWFQASSGPFAQGHMGASAPRCHLYLLLLPHFLFYFSSLDITHFCGSFDTFNCSPLPTPIKFSHPLILAFETFYIICQTMFYHCYFCKWHCFAFNPVLILLHSVKLHGVW